MVLFFIWWRASRLLKWFDWRSSCWNLSCCGTWNECQEIPSMPFSEYNWQYGYIRIPWSLLESTFMCVTFFLVITALVKPAKMPYNNLSGTMALSFQLLAFCDAANDDYLCCPLVQIKAQEIHTARPIGHDVLLFVFPGPWFELGLAARFELVRFS